MTSFGTFQCVEVLLLSVVFLSLFICAQSDELYTKREKRNETQVSHNDTTSSGKASCAQAELPADRTLRRALCHTYRIRKRKPLKTDETPQVCRSVVGDELLYTTPDEQEWRENLFVTYTVRLRGGSGQIPRMPESPRGLLTKFCWQLIIHMYCKFLLPKCDLTSSVPQPQPICKEACREFRNRCQREWNQIQRTYKSVSWRVQQFASGVERSSSLMWCKDLPRRSGPDIPECYYPEMLKDKAAPPVPITDTCFYGDGQSYRGNVSATRSGYPCQSWSSQCPHRHYRKPNNFSELENAGNACRNPGGQAPHGPWCYTRNPNVRWEYCRVDKCEVQK